MSGAAGAAKPGWTERWFAFDDLAEALSSGRLLGTPVAGRAPTALLAVLEDLGWPIDPRGLAGAMPHFPERYGLAELRDTLAALGFESRLRPIWGKALLNCPRGTLVVSDDGRLLQAREDVSGRVSLVEPGAEEDEFHQGRHEPVSLSRRYITVQFQPMHRLGSDAARRQQSWSAGIWTRFLPQIRLLFVLSLISGLLTITVSFAITMVFDTVVPASAFDTLLALIVGVFGLVGLDVLLRLVKARCIGRISGRLEYLLGTALFGKILSLPLDMLTAAPVSDQITRLRQFETIRDLFNGPFSAVILELPFAIVVLLAVTTISPFLAAVLAGLVVVFALAGACLVPRTRRDGQALSEARRIHTQFLLDTIANRRQIGRDGLGPVWLARLADHSAALATARRRHAAGNALLTTLSNTALPLSAATVIGSGALLAMAGALTGGQLVAVTILTWRVLSPVQQALLLVSKLPEIAGLLRQIDALMRIETQAEPREAPLTPVLQPSIGAEAVVFRYPGSLVPALAGVSFTIEPGQMVAVAGLSGAGKSTLLRVLAGLAKPQSGTVRLGGVNLQQLSRSELRRYVGYVSQSPTIFYGTLAQNLRFVEPSATDAELTAVLEEVGLSNWLARLQNGLDTRFDPGRDEAALPPAVLSQISLAQALLARPRILLLDEVASGLNPDEERAMLTALERRHGDVTCLMVTHRPSLARRADSLLKVSAGQVRHEPVAGDGA